MVAYKNLLDKDRSLIEQGGIAELEENVLKANAIFASLEAGDGVWTLSKEYEGDAEDAYAALISALGYEYQARYSKHDVEVQDGEKTAGELKYNTDGSPMMFNLYEDSALEYVKNDRPNNQNNLAKVNASNAALETAIAYFVTAEEPEEPSEPNTLVIKDDAYVVAYLDEDNTYDEFTAMIYGIDTMANVTEDGSLIDNLTTAYGDEYLEIIVGDSDAETTGTIINVLDEDENVVESYVFVYFGDVNMDGSVTSTDGFWAEYYEGMGEGLDYMCQVVAADVNADGSITSTDGFWMEYFEGMGEGLNSQQEIAEGVYGNVY
jgi:hypothetical protein